MVGHWATLPEEIPVSRTTYWLVVDDGKITAMVWMGY